MLYELDRRIRNPYRIPREFRSYGRGAFAALYFTVMTFQAVPQLSRERLMAAYELNADGDRPHTLIRMFKREDLELTWGYLVKNQLIKPVE